MKKWHLFALKFFISIALITLVIYKVGLRNIYSILSTINTWQIFLFLITFPIAWLFAAINLNLLLKPTCKKVPLLQLCYVKIKSWCTGQLSLGRTGEYSLVYFLHKYGVTIAESTVIFVLDNGITLALMLMLSIAGFFIFLPFHDAAVFTLVSIIICGVAALLILHKKGRALITRFILRRFAYKFEGFGSFIRNYFRHHKANLAANIAVSAIKHLVASYTYYLLIISFNEYATFMSVTIILATAMVLTLIPLSLSGLGIKEYSSVFMFSLIGVSAATILSIQLIYLFITYCTTFIVVLAYKHQEGK